MTKTSVAPASRQERLEPADGVDIEVIRRLVQQEDIGLGDQSLGEQYATLHPGGKVFESRVRVQTHARDDGLHAMVRAVRGMLRRLRVPSATWSATVPVWSAGDILGKRANSQALLANDLALVRLEFPADQPQERALTFAVATQQADPFARLDLQLDLIEQARASEGQTDVS